MTIVRNSGRTQTVTSGSETFDIDNEDFSERSIATNADHSQLLDGRREILVYGT